MSLQNLDNLVKAGQLKIQSYNQREFIGLVNSARARLTDALSETLSIESRFDLAYNAAHAFALAELLVGTSQKALLCPPYVYSAVVPRLVRGIQSF